MISYSGNKIIYVSITNGAGGAEQILLMSARVSESKLIFLKKVNSSALPISENEENVKFLNKISILYGFIILLKEILPYRKNHLIVSSHPYLNAYLGLLKRIGFLNSKLVTRECTSVFSRFTGLKRFSYKLVYYLGYPAIDLVICQTPEMKFQLVNTITFLKDKKVIVLKNPIDLQRIKFDAELKVDDLLLDTDYICSAGRLINLKGFHILISAFATIFKKYPTIKLIILGEGGERKKLEDQITSLGLQESVILKGFVSNPYPYFKKAKICVVSSIREGFPNVLLQMMALNNSVVSTLCAGGIEKFSTIKTVQPDNVADLTSAIEFELLSLSSSEENKNSTLISDRSPQEFLRTILEFV